MEAVVIWNVLGPCAAPAPWLSVADAGACTAEGAGRGCWKEGGSGGYRVGSDEKKVNKIGDIFWIKLHFSRKFEFFDKKGIESGDGWHTNIMHFKFHRCLHF